VTKVRDLMAQRFRLRQSSSCFVAWWGDETPAVAFFIDVVLVKTKVVFCLLKMDNFGFSVRQILAASMQMLLALLRKHPAFSGVCLASPCSNIKRLKCALFNGGCS
jgi:hypothetical protein